MIYRIFENRHDPVYIIDKNSKKIYKGYIACLNKNNTVDIHCYKKGTYSEVSIKDFGKFWSFNRDDLEKGTFLYESKLISAFNRLTEGRKTNKNYEIVSPEIIRTNLVNRALTSGIYVKSSRTGLIRFCPRVKYAWRNKCNELVLYTSSHSYVCLSDYGVSWDFTRGALY